MIMEFLFLVSLSTSTQYVLLKALPPIQLEMRVKWQI